ncbi:MAG: hypothetical protein QT11_C0001G0339 [archaeon GW2011_AR20]|nr:MAG: hypothetical protein QT11_C0001G0339 [archaeon GW2011_AR20]AQS28507.1 hypothetical protein [uncultured archaeon]AQS28617.1 hypothetical protein [uncultured archaeon]MBS3160347.1 hypothetical protein [Candidatus Woesearchaeota archaeon]
MFNPLKIFKKKEPELPEDNSPQQDLPMRDNFSVSGLNKEDLILSRLETINAKLENIDERLKKIEEIASS